MHEVSLAAVSRRERRIALSPRFKDGRFRNTHPTKMMREPFDTSMALDFLAGRAARSPKVPLPLFEHTKRVLASPPDRGLRVTWLGHSTVLVEIDGVRLLTDPVWGERVSPVSFAGPRRFHRAPLALSELPPIDAVVLSHDHYDHLCAPTVRALARGAAPGFSGRFITALGVGAHLERLGVAPGNIAELDWSEGAKVGGVDVVAVPAQHFSGRGAFDRNRTLWAGFAIVGPRHRVFFSGDTGPTEEHADIGASFGPFDVALFEIGAWHPAWGDIHLGPAAALTSFQRVNARALLPIHWSTFDLGLHPWQEPAEELLSARTRRFALDAAPRPAGRRKRREHVTLVAGGRCLPSLNHALPSLASGPAGRPTMMPPWSPTVRSFPDRSLRVVSTACPIERVIGLRPIVWVPTLASLRDGC